MGKKTFGILIALLAAMSGFSIMALAADTPEISVTFLNQDPDPAEPGTYFKARFKVENIGLGEAKNVEIEVLPDFPFTLYQDSAVKQVTSISGRQTGSEAKYIDYNLRIDDTALPGTHQIELRYRIDGGSWRKLDAYDVNIKQQEVIVSLYSAESSPEVVRPGEKMKLSLSFQNMASTPVKYFTVSLGLVTTLSTTTSVSITELPFSPVASSNEKVVNALNSGQKVTLDFSLAVDNDAESKIYKVPVTYTYTDQSNTAYTKTNYISIVVGDKPDMTASIESSSVYTAGQEGEIIVKFVNKGLNDIKFMYATLKPTDEYSLLSPEKIYIGKIDSDDYETIEVKVFVDETAKGSISLPLTLEYKDINNNDYTDEISLPVKIYSQQDAKKFGLVPGNGTYIYAIVIVVLLAGFFVYRKLRKKK